VLQPSGATGFGQDFSALHVNGWGFDAIDDIILGTKEFLATHNSADAENVGCIGASYGGYTTMLIQTRTNIFKTAISHAGISSITS
jgi:dipeptidyl aminopeptidase/acylaminoacyl peptidase